MKQRVLHLFISIISAFALIAVPFRVIAEGSNEDQLPPVIITEIQTGAATASDEFIELYNRSAETVDIAGWQIRYINSTVTTGTTTLLATITPTSGDSVLLQSGKYFVLHTQSVSVPSTTSGQVFTAALSKTDKTVALFARDEALCEMIVHDAIAWEVTPGTTLGEGSGVIVSSANANKDKLLQRYRNTGQYVDTNHNSLDVSLSTTFGGATPGADNTQVLTSPASTVGDPSSLESLEAQNCTPPEPDPDPDPIPDPPDESPPSETEEEEETEEPRPSIPAGNQGLSSPQISELLPNPGSPKTDANDEFIELYNSNDKPFTLSGYVLEVGTTSKRRYTFPAGTVLAPKTFTAFFSADTRLGLSNTSGQVRLIDPLGRTLVESEVYSSAKDDQVWVLANGKWQWSLSPTPNAVNLIKTPEPKAKKSSATKKSAVKESTTKTKDSGGQDQEETQVTTVASTNSGTPLHPGVLALVGGFALLYGAYEYRHDVANKIRKFRNDRAARRAAR